MIIEIKGGNDQYQTAENQHCCQDVKYPEPLLEKDRLHKCDKHREGGVRYQSNRNGGYLNSMEEGDPVDR